jgi:predicted NBD/HSP70 family sugar kinase
MTQGVESRWDVMHAVLAQGDSRPTQRTLAALTDLSPRTISKVLARERLDGYLEGSRPARLGVGLGLVLGISLGSETLRAGLVDANGVVHEMATDPLRPGQLGAEPKKIMTRIKAIAQHVLRDAIKDENLRPPGSPDLLLAGAAVAWPAPVDRAKRLRGRAIWHSDWKRPEKGSELPQSLPDRLSEALGPPFTPKRCHALNDLSAHALAVTFDDSRRAAKEPKNDEIRVVLVVRIGGALGSGIAVTAPHDSCRLSFIDTRLIEGTSGLAGELGHLPVGRRLIEEVNEGSDLAPMDYDTWLCSCGKPRHLEGFASGKALIRRLRESGHEIPETNRAHKRLLSAIASEDLDDDQREALRDIGRIVGRAFVGPILMLDPDNIVVTGALAGTDVKDGMNRVRDSWRSVIDDSVEIEARGGEGGAWAGVRGAGLAILRRTVYRGFLDQRLEFPEVFSVSSADARRMR